MSAPLAELRHVGVCYGKRPVLRDICLNIESGDFWTLIGPNGAGKSTLLGLFNGLTRCSQGVVRFKGATLEPGGMAAVRRQVAHVF